MRDAMKKNDCLESKKFKVCYLKLYHLQMKLEHGQGKISRG